MASVTDIQQTALSFATRAEANMLSMSDQAAALIYTPIDWFASWNAPEYVRGWTGGYFYAPSSISLPSITATKPTTPTLNEVTIPEFEAAPQFLTAYPNINIPPAPNNELPPAPGDAPEFNAPMLPLAPTYLTPDVPVFENIVVPPLPSVSYPTFSSVLPVDDLLAPSEVFTYVEPIYDSALLDELKSKLLYDLINGGYGIENEDEMRLWQRAREREAINSEAAIQDVTRQVAARGFDVPPGTLNAMVQAAQQTALENNSTLSREILVKKADLYVQNRQFTIQQARETEQMLITAFGYMCERMLNSAKAVVELSIAVFNARVAKYNYSLERYKADAAVYESLIRGVALQLDAYKTQIEGLKLSADIQRIHAEVYKVQIDGINALVNIYKTEMEAAKVVVEIESIRLDAFKAQVDTYVAQVGAKTAEFGMFESQIKGEMAKVDVYAEEAKAYGTKVQAYKTKVEASEVVTRTQVQTNQLKIQSFVADIQRYSAELQSSQIALQNAVAKYDGDIKAYGISVDAQVRASQQNVEAGKANAQTAVAHANMILGNIVQASSVQSQRANASAQTFGSMASAFGSEAAAALSAASGIITQST